MLIFCKKQKKYSNIVLFRNLLILLILSLYGCQYNKIFTTEKNNQKIEQNSQDLLTDSYTDKINQSTFDNIKEGMTLQDVQNYLGVKGYRGVAKSGNIEIESYSWYSRDGSKLINVAFQNGKVISKTGAGF
ncbi:hypothetical protein [Cyanobacterium sp. Dongsha4]|uniref:hypothetical protein n=1 Tax=Cyanobacterium sp. DS4 TaxID=2878255 RepID=UPI002E81DC49|nr:hypothetical protein [Cyanobacterium sp. Dongsha4]WVK99458.1 hypothetical protein Dongsha4_12285 [Cyanobacterium sp. Dongsha4]